MLKTIAEAALRFRGVVIALGCLLLVYGGDRLAQVQYDVFPEFAPPQVIIQTEAPGLAPEQVEQLVTTPLENAINGVAGIDSLRSGSIQGISVITVTFQAGTDIYLAQQLVNAGLSSVRGQLPAGAEPVIAPVTSSTSTVLVIGLTSQKRSLMELRTIADWTVQRRLLAVQGVAKVVVFGGDIRQLQIQLYPDRLIGYRISAEDVVAAAKRATGIRGAGFIDTDNQRIELKPRGQSLTPSELAATVVSHEQGASVTLGNVAMVRAAPAPAVGAASIMGKPGVMLIISAQYGANTLEVTNRVEKALDELRPTLKKEDVVLTPALFRPANFIHTAIANVKSALLIGAVLVSVVLLLFLFNLRTTAISVIAIPLSLLAAVTTLELLGLSLNTMSLGGLAIATGLLVDDAVITVENIYRRLRENQHALSPRSILVVIRDATFEVRSAVVYATLAVALVFLPVLTLPGLAGSLFAPLAVAYILATLASLVVALTLTPALCYVFLSGRKITKREPPLYRWLKAPYRRLLLRVEAHPRLVIGAVIVFTGAGLAIVPFLSARFIPELKEGHFIVHMTMASGTSLNQSLHLGRQVTAELLKLPYVRSVAQHVGRAEKADDIFGTNVSELEVDLKPLNGPQSEAAGAAIYRVLSGIPGASFAVKTFLSERIEETLSGQLAAVVVNVFGNNLDVLDAKVKDLENILRSVPGAANVRLAIPADTPNLVVRLRPDALQRWGLHPVDVLEALGTLYEGNVVAQIYNDNRIFDVAVILNPKLRSRIASAGELPLRSPDGVYLPLTQVAHVYETSGRQAVLHEGARRVQTVICDVSGGDTASFVAAAQKKIAAAVALPSGTYVEFSGTAQAQSQSQRSLLLNSAVALVFIVLLLSLVLARLRNLFLIFLNLPFALVGGVLAVIALGGAVSIGGLVGFVTLFGITLRNAIMMVSHYEHLVRLDGQDWGLEAALRGAEERLMPILMTALITAFGLLPLALTSEAPGNEIEGPMAIIILGGLVTSTVLNLLVLPTLALRYGHFERDSEAQELEIAAL